MVGLGASAAAAEGYTDLLRAALRRQADRVDALLAGGDPRNEQNHLGHTALHYAVLRSRPDADYSPRMVESILRYGGDQNMIDHEGLTPPALAVMTGNQLGELLEHGGDPNGIAPTGLSLLATAEPYGRESIPAALRSHGGRYGVSHAERQLIPELSNTLKFAKALAAGYERSGRNLELLPELARAHALEVWPDICADELKRAVEHAQSTLGSCAYCPATSSATLGRAAK